MNPSVLLTVGAEQPLIDLDWTVVVQLGLFLATALVASRFLFRPYLAMRESRAAGIEGAREEAEQMSAQAAAQLADYESRVAAARSRVQEERRKVRAEALARQNEITEKAKEEATRAFAEAHATVESEVSRARDDLMPRAEKLATEIASKLLGREVAS